MTTTGHTSLPAPLTTTLANLLAILDSWLTEATDAVCDDLTRFATTEYEYHGDRWDLLDDLSRASLALHRHLTASERNQLP